MPLRIGEYVRVNEDGELCMVVRLLGRGYYRVRVVGESETLDLSEWDVTPVAPDHRIGAAHRFNAGRRVAPDERLVFPDFAAQSAGQSSAAASASAAAATTTTADSSKGAGGRPSARERFASRGKTLQLQTMIGGGHEAEYAENCAMVTAAAVITYGSELQLRLNSADVASRIAQNINSRVNRMALHAASSAAASASASASSSSASSSASSSSAAAAAAPVSALNQSGMRFTDLALFEDPDSQLARSIGRGTVRDLMQGDALGAHLIGFQLFCYSVLQAYGLRTCFYGTSTNMVPLPQIKTWMRWIATGNPGAVFAVYSGGHWNFACVVDREAFFTDYQRDHPDSTSVPRMERAFVSPLRFRREEPATPKIDLSRSAMMAAAAAPSSSAAAGSSSAAAASTRPGSFTDLDKKGVAFAFF